MKKLFIKIFKILTIIFVIGIVLFITFILLMFLVFTEVMSYLTLSFLIVFGWIGGLFQWMKGLTIEPAALMTGFIAFLLFLYFLHRTIRAFNSDWLFRRSIGLAGILLPFRFPPLR